jgi:ATP-dependent RNA helicase RhlE
MEGLAISLFCDEEEAYLRDIEKLLKKPVAREVYKGEIQILNADHPSEDDDRRGGRETDRVKRQRHGGLSRKNDAAPAPSNQREGGGRDDEAPRSGIQRPGFLRKGSPKSGNPKSGGWNSPGNVKRAPRNEQEKPFESGRRGGPASSGTPGRQGGAGRTGGAVRTGSAGRTGNRRGSGSSGDGRKNDAVKDSINSVTGRDERPSAGKGRRGRDR